MTATHNAVEVSEESFDALDGTPLEGGFNVSFGETADVTLMKLGFTIISANLTSIWICSAPSLLNSNSPLPKPMELIYPLASLIPLLSVDDLAILVLYKGLNTAVGVPITSCTISLTIGERHL